MEIIPSIRKWRRAGRGSLALGALLAVMPYVRAGTDLTARSLEDLMKIKVEVVYSASEAPAF